MNHRACFNINNLCFSYGRHNVLDNLSITFEAGKFYGIVGPNGCGKTTLLDLLIKNKDPLSGKIDLGESDLKHYSRKDLAKKVTLVPQNFYINFAFTVMEIVLMGRHPYIPRFSSPSAHDLDIVEEIITETGIEAFKNKYITELSGGERQRVVFAKALAQDTPVLILDEATSNLDIKHTIDILNVVDQKVKSEKRTVIAVMHDLNLAAKYCDGLMFMKDGKFVVHGDTGDVLNEKNIKDVFEVDSKIITDSYSRSKQVVFKR